MARPRQGVDAYTDVRPIWAAAITHNSIQHKFDSEAAAIQCVQRLHGLRLRWRELQTFEGFMADKFVVGRDGPLVRITKRDEHDVAQWQAGDEAVDKQKVLDFMNDVDREALEKEGYAFPDSQFDPNAPLSLDTE